LSGLDAKNRLSGRVNQRKEVCHSIALRRQHDDAKPGLRQILLELDIPVPGHKNLEALIRRPAQQLTVAQTGPSFLLNCADIVRSKFARQTTRQLLIEKYAQRCSEPRARLLALQSLGRAKLWGSRR
jgi:hypothetical protein